MYLSQNRRMISSKLLKLNLAQENFEISEIEIPKATFEPKCTGITLFSYEIAARVEFYDFISKQQEMVELTEGRKARCPYGKSSSS